MDPETLIVTPYELSVERGPVVVYDTPGLDDQRGDEEEEEHLEVMESLLARGKIHLVIYCFKMIENKMRKGLIRTFQEYHKIGVPWVQTIMTFTFADMVVDTTTRFSVMKQKVKKTFVEKFGVMEKLLRI